MTPLLLRWPQDQASLPSYAAGAPATVVLMLTTPATPLREQARARSRQALREALAILLDCQDHEIRLEDVSGQPLRLLAPRSSAGMPGLSLAHEPGISLVAIHRDGPVGVDLLALPAQSLEAWLPDWQGVARDYLGPRSPDRIACAANPAQAFAREWTRLEACLKCCGQPLSEWGAPSRPPLAACRAAELDMPAGWMATLATRR